MSSWRFKDKVGSLITRVEISFVYRFSVRHRLKVKRSCAIESSRVLARRGSRAQMSDFQTALYPGSLLMRSCLEEMHTWSSCSS